MYYFTKPFNDVPFKEDVVTYDTIIQEVDGRKVQMFVARTKDPNEGLSYEDFSLKSLIDADALDLLNPIAPISRTPLYAADLVGSIASNIGSVLDNVKDVEPSKSEVNE